MFVSDCDISAKQVKHFHPNNNRLGFMDDLDHERRGPELQESVSSGPDRRQPRHGP